MGKFAYLLAWAALGSPVHAVAQPIPANLPLGAGPDRTEQGAARIVGSILTYTRWPAPTDPVHLCVVGPADHDRLLGEVPVPADGPGIRRSDLSVAAAADPDADCDAVYLGRIGLPAMRRVTAAVRSRAVVTIAEADPECRSNAMFCLTFGPAGLSFRMNVDAISRSGVRIDPRVLRVARGN